MDHWAKKSLMPQIRRFYGPLLAFLVGGTISLAIFDYVSRDIERDAQQAFERHGVDAKHIIERRLHSYVGVAYGVWALFATKPMPSRAEFHSYIKALDLPKNYPGFDSVNFATQIKAKEKALFEAQVREDRSIDSNGYPNFRIFPQGDRPDYHVLTYLEPMKGQESVLGFDISVGAAQTAAQNRARDSGDLISSGDSSAVQTTMNLLHCPCALLPTLLGRSSIP